MARRNRHRNIRRIDHNYFHGWEVCLTRAGVRHQRMFSDDGDRGAAEQQAIHWRDQMRGRRPPPRMLKWRNVLNKTGTVGVHLSRERTRKGTIFERYGDQWTDETGRQWKRSFSVSKYGRREARRRAVRARLLAVAEMLRPRPVV